jgi:hypothetical protein
LNTRLMNLSSQVHATIHSFLGTVRYFARLRTPTSMR